MDTTRIKDAEKLLTCDELINFLRGYPPDSFAFFVIGGDNTSECIRLRITASRIWAASPTAKDEGEIKQ